MATAYTDQYFLDQLDAIKKRKQRFNNYQSTDWRGFVPQELDTKIQEPTFYNDMQQGIVNRSRARTQIVQQEAQNRAAYQAMLRAQRAKQRAINHMVHVNHNPTVFGNPNAGPVISGGHIGKGGHFHDPTPLSGVGVGANLVHVGWHGHSLTLNRSAADNFVGFLNALYKTGYRPAVIGSYANRNIAGTSTKSLHAYGLAIDIDPARNPVTWNGVNVTALPPGVGALAARYGLKWGGSWHGSKRDTMHFSIPWGGRE